MDIGGKQIDELKLLGCAAVLEEKTCLALAFELARSDEIHLQNELVFSGGRVCIHGAWDPKDEFPEGGGVLIIPIVSEGDRLV